MIIDVGGEYPYIPGLGGCKVVMSPGTRQYKLETALSSHRMLPMNSFSIPATSPSPTLQFESQLCTDSATTPPPQYQ